MIFELQGSRLRAVWSEITETTEHTADYDDNRNIELFFTHQWTAKKKRRFDLIFQLKNNCTQYRQMFSFYLHSWIAFTKSINQT